MLICINQQNLYFIIMFPYIQSEPTKLTPNEDGTIDIPVTDDGSKIIITFEPSDPTQSISVSPIEVTACAEPGSNSVKIHV
jgi:hypothetical protein